MPTPFNVSGGGGGGSGYNNNNNNNNKNTSPRLNQNFQVEIDRDDPSKLFVDLTEIGHGNFGAVYYVIIFVLFSLFSF
jgi:hypothetical protein